MTMKLYGTNNNTVEIQAIFTTTKSVDKYVVTIELVQDGNPIETGEFDLSKNGSGEQIKLLYENVSLSGTLTRVNNNVYFTGQLGWPGVVNVGVDNCIIESF